MQEYEVYEHTGVTRGITCDVLIVGAGPSGASLACFLGRENVSTLMISAAAGTASEPRAHFTNLATLDALRDLGIDGECYQVAQTGTTTGHIRWAETMAGEEYARAWMGGSKPDRLSDYAIASPSKVVDLPQTLLEPILVKCASTGGVKVRFDTQFIKYQELEAGRVISSVKDLLSGEEYHVTSKFVCGADGGRSVVAKQLGLPMVSQSGPPAYNLLVKADMTMLMAHRRGTLHYCLRLEQAYPFMCLWRMVKPWHEWLLIIFPKPGQSYDEPSREEWQEIVNDTIGDPTIKAEIVGISRWLINDTYAEEYSHNNIFCLGDAVHRHPPTGGLGSNTCIQDSFNLAWKLGLVIKGSASHTLLSTYSTERQPVGKAVVKRANAALADYSPVFDALGVMLPTSEDRREALKRLSSPGQAGNRSRAQLREGLVTISDREMQALGIEMGQYYEGSSAIYTSDEATTFIPQGREAQDNVAYYSPSTYPGRRLPHVWLDRSIPGVSVSSIDLAGKGAFCLFTGADGAKWKASAKLVSDQLNIRINAYTIGFRQDWQDVYGDWARLCDTDGIAEDGCVLVRPDLFVAWRATACASDIEACSAKLRNVLQSILGH